MTHNITGRRAEPDHYDVPLRRLSYPDIARLVEGGDLVPHDRPHDEQQDPIKGVRADATFQIASGVDIQPLSNTRLSIGNRVLTGLFSHLPAHAYRGLVTTNSRFSSNELLDDVLLLIRDPDTHPRHIADLVEKAARQGPAPDGVARMCTQSQQFRSVWRPERTLVKQTGSGDWYLTLVFHTTFARLSRAAVTNHIGLDAGLDPFCAAAHDDGRTRLFTPTPLALPERHRLSKPAAALLDSVVYASGRRDAEGLLQYLTHHAHRVAAERLGMEGLNRPYVLRSRDRALQDLHHAWLPQLLNRAGISFVRVPARCTSIHCPRCTYTDRRNRDGRMFICRACRFSEHADIVGAMNVLIYDQQGT